MTGAANPVRGEAELVIDGQTHVLRPTFEALVRAEQELGSLFALVERAGAGGLQLKEMAALFWYCLVTQDAITKNAVGQAVLDMGMAQAAKPLRTLLTQILKGAA